MPQCFEYAEERKEIIKEFSRILKNNGYLSILKHNKAGRVKQMLQMELKVSELKEYKAIALFHHVILRKK